MEGSSFFSKERNSAIVRVFMRFSSGPATLDFDGIFNLLTWLLLGGILELRLRVEIGLKLRMRLGSRLEQVEASEGWGECRLTLGVFFVECRLTLEGFTEGRYIAICRLRRCCTLR